MNADIDVAATTLVAETERLRLRRVHEGDAAFMLELLNQPTFLRFIGDKGVRTLEDARNYIRTGPLASYQLNGFGLYMVELKDSGEAIGTCGILKKPALAHPDLGYALLPAFWARGYAIEAAAATLAHAYANCGLRHVCAVVDPENAASVKLLYKLGMERTGRVQLAPDDKELELFEIDLQR
jgi:ribosomal-protein-alanine N-acetyltransferase